MHFLVLYIIDGILNILSDYLPSVRLNYITKVLLMPLLVVFLWKVCGYSKFTRFLFLALFFSWLGDILLMFPRISYSENTRQLLFIGGLIAFLLAHLSYIVSFLQEISAERKMSVLVGKPFLVIPFVLYLILFLRFLMPYLGPMKFPVFVYGVCITSMCAMAFNRWNLAQQKSFVLVFCGACFFLLSDTILSCNIFYKKTEWGKFAVMFTYIVAQAMIILGVYENKKKRIN